MISNCELLEKRDNALMQPAMRLPAAGARVLALNLTTRATAATRELPLRGIFVCDGSLKCS